MLSANEARKMAQEVIKLKQSRKMDDIETEIKRRARSGILSCYYNGHISSQVKKDLESYGYKVFLEKDERRGNYTYIIW